MFRREAFTGFLDQGSDDLNMPTYNGGLVSQETDNGQFLATFAITDRYLALGLDRLTRDVDDRTQALVFIDFKIKVYSVPSPQDNSARGEVPMPRYDEVTQRAGSLRAMTGFTAQELTALLPHFARALAAYLQDRTIDGQPCTSRRYSTYDNCPLPTMADKLLFMLTYVKQNPIQAVPGQLFGMSPSHANKWIHLLHSVLNQALADPELLPARTAAEFAAMFKTHATDGRSTTPLFGMMALNVQQNPH
jgi:Helix-turn-helix of DDE superfamily endonuclease